jgi:hypothetical protein
MRNDMAHSKASARKVPEGLFSQIGEGLPMLRAIHEAAADVEMSLRFWKKMIKKNPAPRRVSREFLNRQG